ncbi:hypothetical protein HID58_028847 [Brassica napus]|uniref:Chlorophyll(Ide) b reductase NYC1, chloroplastic n=1 Tax=Brassica napus TaxID=3708 RepID=A0ABQ8CBF7_BRANA|nr:hypothetical protein HID58_028847 [Brassica napus]
MVTLTKLQVYPRCLDHRLGFMDHQRVGSRLSCREGNKRVYVHRCESDLEKKKVERGRKHEKEGKGLWDSLKSGVSKLGFLTKDEYNQKVQNLEMVFSSIAVQIARYIVTMTSTGAILLIGFQLSGGDSSMNSLVWYSWLGGVIIGTMTGANMVLEDHYRAGPRNVVITGSTRGLGKALAREFLLSGDRVIVTSRSGVLSFVWISFCEISSESVDMTVKELQQNLKEIMSKASESDRKKLGFAKVVGIACDVCKPEDVERLSSFAVEELGSINIWIVSTNLIGSILCTRGAMEVMSRQDNGGHIFNMDGAGSGGSSTPLTAVYGSTKCGLRQFHGSVAKESQKTKVGLHTASPGMVLTELLLSGSSIKNKQMFNIICELPETVARTLVPRMRVVKGSGKSVNYLTPPRILLAIVTSWLRRGRWFDDQGRALYAAEADRLRNWAENRTRLSLTDAMEMYTENTWVSVFSLSVVCAFIIVSSTTPSSFPGT